jgi:hypothetical protein
MSCTDHSTAPSSQEAAAPADGAVADGRLRWGGRPLDPNVAAGLLAALDQSVGGPEAAARHWYRLLTGDRQRRRRTDPHEEQELRLLLQRIYPDDPWRVELELRRSLHERAAYAEAHCWGRDWQYLFEALAAWCEISPGQANNMTWPEIAAALRTAYESQRCHGTRSAGSSAAEGAEGPSRPAAERPRRGMTVQEADKEARRMAMREKKAFILLSMREQAKRIGCHLNTWKKAPYFKEVESLKALLKAEGGRNKGRGAPRAVSFTPAVEATIAAGEGEEVLGRLTEEQRLAEIERLEAEQARDKRSRKVGARERL